MVPKTGETSDVDWTDLRRIMPVTEGWLYFDHAAVAPITDAARQALNHYATDLATHGEAHLRQWTERIESVRRLAAQLLEADANDIAFVKNTSEGIGLVAEGFPWRSGDNVVIAAEEYPANVYPWMNLRDRGVEVRMVPTRDRRIWIDDLDKHIDDRTRMVSLSYVEFSSGFRNDVTAIGELCRQRGVRFFVDAIQGLGVLPLSVRKAPVDYLAADGHKWLLGPEGAGILFIRRDALEQLRPVGVGWNSVVRATDFCVIDYQLKPHAGRYESGSLNVAGITALGASIEVLLGIGIEAIERRVIDLTDYLCAKLDRAGFPVYSSRRPEDKSAIVSASAPGLDLKDVVRRCRSERIIINHRGGRLRISPHCYNTHDEIDHLVDVLQTTRRANDRAD